jgi:hypothetical protein
MVYLNILAKDKKFHDCSDCHTENSRLWCSQRNEGSYEFYPLLLLELQMPQEHTFQICENKIYFLPVKRELTLGL